jgi:rhamnose utilization protein RhaD (predicted bifunctional aldolase and dehydrogenase)
MGEFSAHRASGADTATIAMDIAQNIRMASIRARETIVRDQPLLAVLVSEQFGASHPEHAPALEPKRSAASAIGLSQHTHDGFTMAILVAQPVIGGR